MTLDEWAVKWGVPVEALRDLTQTCLYQPDHDDSTPKSEARIQSEVRLEHANAGILLFRNNSGAGKLASGNFVRFGLGNDSVPMNKALKSADLIGIRKRLISPADVGSYIGQFYSREVKRTDWKFSGTIEEYAQLRWATLINAEGGDARIVTGVGSLTDR